MKGNTIQDMNEYYDMELDKVVEKINSSGAKLILLQFPDGLKQYAVNVVDYLDEETNSEVDFIIWFGACFGACDSPVGFEGVNPKIDLVIQFGHNALMPVYLER